MVTITDEMDAALDGQAKWMISIIGKYVRKYHRFADAEELFADFVAFYLENRHHFNPERGTRSTFVFQLFRSFTFRKARKIRITTRNVVADVPVVGLEYDEDEIELLEQFAVQPRKSASRLAKDMGRKERHIEETLDSLKAKIAQRNSKQRAVVCK
jgi:DNA-directed RNA polymerase specialized sigma24 family protein